MIISCVSYKGGAGKTTVCQNLAVYFAHKGKSVCVIDADGSGATSRWSAAREAADGDLPRVTVVPITEDSSFIGDVKKINTKYDFVLVDGPPSVSKIAAKIIAVSDLILVPVNPGSGSDIWVTDKFIEFYEGVMELTPSDDPIPLHFILTNFDRRINMHKVYVEALKGYEGRGYSLLESILTRRIAYGEANQAGQGVFEYDKKTIGEEIAALGIEVISL